MAWQTAPGGGGVLQTTFRNALMKMQFGDVTQPPDAQAKFSRVSAMLLLAWQPRPKVPWAGRGCGNEYRWPLGGREAAGGGWSFQGPRCECIPSSDCGLY